MKKNIEEVKKKLQIPDKEKPIRRIADFSTETLKSEEPGAMNFK